MCPLFVASTKYRRGLSYGEKRIQRHPNPIQSDPIDSFNLVTILDSTRMTVDESAEIELESLSTPWPWEECVDIYVNIGYGHDDDHGSSK